MNCKDCFFYTGIKCHGQGDFWGECELINVFVKINRITNKLSYKDYDCYSSIRYDDSPCLFNDVLKLKK